MGHGGYGMSVETNIGQSDVVRHAKDLDTIKSRFHLTCNHYLMGIPNFWWD